MRAVVCRVNRASVVADGEVTGRVGVGLLVYLGVLEGDGEAEAQWMAKKLPVLRVFNDDDGKMNGSVVDTGGGILIIPNFTLAGRTRKGTRPSYGDAADPAVATGLFDRVVELCRASVPVETGVFGAHMVIDAEFNGPVTVVVDTP
ncbi:MAG: D-aminoacyl-tRNA deacylase [Planctomycetota bacterium]|jgi:D-tyrosyl-tRNA(Tyr) deacylase